MFVNFARSSTDESFECPETKVHGDNVNSGRSTMVGLFPENHEVII